MMPVAMRLIQLLGRPVSVIGGEKIAGEDALSASLALKDGQIMMLENLRFNDGEKSCIASRRYATSTSTTPSARRIAPTHPSAACPSSSRP